MLTNKLPTVSIGIPAYNEEANIKKLLQAILKQKEDGFTLEKIIVASDGSADGTVELARSIKDDRIKVIDNKERKGAITRENDILDISNSDILVMLDADNLPNGAMFLAHIIKPFAEDNTIGIVSAKTIPIPPKTYFERILYFSRKMTTEIFENINHGNNPYLCAGSARAFQKSFYSQFRWNETICEDVFSYLACLSSGFKFMYTPDAVSFYKLPSSIKDHLHQSIRYAGCRKRMKILFNKKGYPPNFVIDNLKIPFGLKVRKTVKYAFKNCILFFLYTLVLIFARIKSITRKNLDSRWEMAHSTKNLGMNTEI